MSEDVIESKEMADVGAFVIDLGAVLDLMILLTILIKDSIGGILLPLLQLMYCLDNELRMISRPNV